MGVVKE